MRKHPTDKTQPNLSIHIHTYLEGHLVICGVVRKVLVEDAGAVTECGLHREPQG